jgi:hypothetical protein
LRPDSNPTAPVNSFQSYRLTVSTIFFFTAAIFNSLLYGGEQLSNEMGPITAADIILFVTHSKKQQGLSLTTIIHTNKQKTQNFNKVGIAPFLWLSIPLFLRLLQRLIFVQLILIISPLFPAIFNVFMVRKSTKHNKTVVTMFFSGGGHSRLQIIIGSRLTVQDVECMKDRRALLRIRSDMAHQERPKRDEN